MTDLERKKKKELLDKWKEDCLRYGNELSKELGIANFYTHLALIINKFDKEKAKQYLLQQDLTKCVLDQCRL